MIELAVIVEKKEVYIVQNLEISLRSLREVQNFVRLADSCTCDVNIGYDRILIDAKSIVGVMGLDLGRRMKVSFEERNAALEEFCLEHAAV